MKGLGSFALPIVGLAAFITLAQCGNKPRNVDEVYALLKERLDLVEQRLQDTERSLNAERIRSRTVKVKVRRLERERNLHKGSDIPVVQGEVCGVSCQFQLDNLRSGMIAEKHKASQADKAVRAVKSRLQNLSKRVDAIELDSQRLMDRVNTTGKMIDIFRRRSDGLSTKLGAISLKAEGAMTNSYQANQTVQELKAVIGSQSARIDATDRTCVSLMKKSAHTEKTVSKITTLVQDLRFRKDHIEHGAMADYLSGATDVEGSPSSRFSTVTCPDNTTVVGCRCSHEDKTCDGVDVYGQTCWAYKSLKGSNPIQAHARCVHGVSFTVIRDPERGTTSRPLARCPSHTRVVACWLYNRRMGRRYVRTRLDRGDNSCTVSKACYGSQCSIQALCRESEEHNHQEAGAI